MGSAEALCWSFEQLFLFFLRGKHLSPANGVVQTTLELSVISINCFSIYAQCTTQTPVRTSHAAHTLICHAPIVYHPSSIFANFAPLC